MVQAATVRRVVATDVARVAGVSQKTVSRVVNDDPHVRDEVRDRVRTVIAQLGYQPNRAARTLVGGSTRTIGLLAIGTSAYGPTSQTVAAERAVRDAGYTVVLRNTLEGDPDPEAVAAAISGLHEQGVDGLVINEPTGTYTPPASVAHLPVLILSGRTGVSSREVTVQMDQAGGATALVEHLLGLGHRSVHHVSGPLSWHAANERRDAWSEACRRAGAPRPDPLPGDWSVGSGYAAGLELAGRPDVTAVFCSNDQMAIGVIRALADRGRRVPEDVSVAGFDDVPEAAYLHRSLTTVRQHLADGAERGVRLLLHAIETGEHAAHQELVPTEVVVRETTAPPGPG